MNPHLRERLLAADNLDSHEQLQVNVAKIMKAIERDSRRRRMMSRYALFGWLLTVSVSFFAGISALESHGSTARDPAPYLVLLVCVFVLPSVVLSLLYLRDYGFYRANRILRSRHFRRF